MQKKENMIGRVSDFVNRSLSMQTHKIRSLPILILMPHSRCNCRCVMCDIWKANINKQELSVDDLQPHIESLVKLKLKQVVLSGGEPLMHSNLWTFCELLKSHGIKITLLSTGLLMEKYAADIIKWCDEVIVSIDGSESVHNQIRNIPDAYKKLKQGIIALKKTDPNFRITGRCVLQKLNYQDLPNIIKAARALNLDQISFLAADVSTLAFNRPEPLPRERVVDIALNAEEALEFSRIIERIIDEFKRDFQSRFIAENPDKMRSLAQYYLGLNDESPFPAVRCNAPWVSAVIETNGDVLPCFFHPKIGNIFEQDIAEILNDPRSVAFRKGLNVQENPICKKCVCSLYLKPTDSLT